MRSNDVLPTTSAKERGVKRCVETDDAKEGLIPARAKLDDETATCPPRTFSTQVGYAQQQQRGMEDVFAEHRGLYQQQPLRFYAVFDGHGSSRGMHANHVAHFCATQLRLFLLERLCREPALLDDPLRVCEAMRAAFVAFDEMMFAKKTLECGSTCTCLLVDDARMVAYSANLGDSRTIVFDDRQKLIFETKDHGWTDVLEVKRAIEAGSCVAYGRLDGGLNVSRSFGDWADKHLRKVQAAGEGMAEQMVYSATKGPVCAVPDVTFVRKSDYTHTLLRAILTSDGVFESRGFDSLSLLNLFARKHHPNNLQATADAMLLPIIEGPTTDDVTLAIVDLF